MDPIDQRKSFDKKRSEENIRLARQAVIGSVCKAMGEVYGMLDEKDADSVIFEELLRIAKTIKNKMENSGK